MRGKLLCVDPDQTPPSVTSNPGLYCWFMPAPIFRIFRANTVYTFCISLKSTFENWLESFQRGYIITNNNPPIQFKKNKNKKKYKGHNVLLTKEREPTWIVSLTITVNSTNTIVNRVCYDQPAHFRSVDSLRTCVISQSDSATKPLMPLTSYKREFDSVYPDQTPQNAASGLGLHRLPLYYRFAILEVKKAFPRQHPSRNTLGLPSFIIEQSIDNQWLLKSSQLDVSSFHWNVCSTNTKRADPRWLSRKHTYIIMTLLNPTFI